MSPSILLAIGRAPARRVLRDVFEEEFFDVTVEEAGTFAAARAAFERTTRPAFSLVVLDARLPVAEDGPYRSDVYVFPEIAWMAHQTRRMTQDAPFDCLILVANVRDPVVISWRRLAKQQTEEQPAGISARAECQFFDKTPLRWADDFLDAARKIIYPKLILNRLFDIWPLFAPLAVRSDDAAQPCCYGRRDLGHSEYMFKTDPSHRLAVLMRDIEQYWVYLGETLQKDLRNWFQVTQAEDRSEVVSVTLL